MKKQFIFSAMLGLCAFGGTTVYPSSALAAVAQSPSIKVSGQVIDEQGLPLLGATIRVKDGQTGTTTDFDGNFQLEVPGNSVLLISYVGYKDREVAVRNRAVLEPIQMQTDDLMLEQVVVVGYGTQKKSDLTGSVSVVDAEALKQVSHSNISSMLEGKVAGVQITSDGQPGADPSVRIRGIGSFGSTAPLYVIDGVPMGTRTGSMDPAVMTFLMNKGMTAKEIDNLVNKESGVAGISGVSSDFRDLSAAADSGNERAELALAMFGYQVKKFIGSYAAAMGGIDAVVFTAGVGENDAAMRKEIVSGLEFMGIKIDDAKNSTRGTVDVSATDATVKTLVIPTDEEMMIAIDTKRLVEG